MWNRSVTAVKIVAGLLGLVVFAWPIKTFEGFVVFVSALAVLLKGLVIAMIVNFPKHQGNWPNRSEGRLTGDYPPPTDPQDKPLT